MANDTVRLTDIAVRIPALLVDAPVILRGVLTAFLTRPSAKTSIGKVFQHRAARHSGDVFIRFEDEVVTYGQANETANRYAAVLAARGVQRGDVVAIILENSPLTVLLILAVVKLGAIAGMLNYHHRGSVLAHSVELLKAKALIGDDTLLEAVAESGAKVGQTISAGELERLAADAPSENPAVTSTVRAEEPAFYIFTSGTTGAPKASVMTHYRWLRALGGSGALGMRLKNSDTLYCCLPLYHNSALTVGVSGVLSAGATLALGRSFSASRFWDEVRRYDATAFLYIGEICRYLLNQPEKDSDHRHRVRVIGGNGLQPDIWEEFVTRFHIPRVFEFYGASESNTGFVNLFNIPKTAGVCPTAVAFVEYDPETGDPVRDERGRVRKVRGGTPGLLLSKVTKKQPFEGYTDAEATEKKLVRNAFRVGDVWINTGDLMRPQGWRHAVFVDRLGDTFRWKGENVATTDVEAAVSSDPTVEAVTVFGVQVPGTDGRAGMAAVVPKEGQSFDGASLAKTVYEQLPSYAMPLFVRVVDSLEHTPTFKKKKADLREQGYGPDLTDPLYVLEGRDEGYVPYYDEYPGKVAAGSRPKS
ncbi:long-chain-acyl-CoA synthetase FadD6 [Mycobacterium noviomagense]|uniref:Long-chain-acyl-CoA synthetase n=1 Tax=Mycobacterium noviomagense TaxID=459858 RepID=A0A7I7PGM7_9MYCO|nr:long-chain-acyl-CoA synthetase FadD6 [Mycobacterium noviomagense]ORB13333.1 long-chain-acyl-CoA synthetase [Mycobacterium noviomagense]BBY07701.1 long-chain-acyl-CoA synthetase [Mycobacterium noviomagense]